MTGIKRLSEAECVKLWDEYALPANVRAHCRLVSRVAGFLAEKLRAKGIQVQPQVVRCAALLHDLMKVHAIQAGGDEYAQVERVLSERGFPVLGRICARHGLYSILEPFPDRGWEEKLVFYADKRVQHDQLVSVEERLEDLAARYGAGNPHEAAKIRACLPLVKALEREIFDLIGESPELKALEAEK